MVSNENSQVSLNFPKTIENTGEIGFFGFVVSSSQTVVTPLPVTVRAIQRKRRICFLRLTVQAAELNGSKLV